jgi:hypothetical protein
MEEYFWLLNGLCLIITTTNKTDAQNEKKITTKEPDRAIRRKPDSSYNASALIGRL